MDYILTRLKEDGKLPANAAVVKSFVTTGMAKPICQNFGVELFEVPVGFKFIGEKNKAMGKGRQPHLCIRVRGELRISARHAREG